MTNLQFATYCLVPIQQSKGMDEKVWYWSSSLNYCRNYFIHIYIYIYIYMHTCRRTVSCI